MKQTITRDDIKTARTMRSSQIHAGYSLACPELADVLGPEFAGAYTNHVLCDARSKVRVGTEAFQPGVGDVCAECAVRFSARYSSEVPGWTKTCACCLIERAVTEFRVDARTSDGMARNCEDCREDGREETRRDADRRRQENFAREHELAMASAALLEAETVNLWQRSSFGKAMVCQVDPAHGALEAHGVGDEVRVVCGTCGESWPISFRATHALGQVLNLDPRDTALFASVGPH